jgi:hypothetical protein
VVAGQSGRRPSFLRRKVFKFRGETDKEQCSLFKPLTCIDGWLDVGVSINTGSKFATTTISPRVLTQLIFLPKAGLGINDRPGTTYAGRR